MKTERQEVKWYFDYFNWKAVTETEYLENHSWLPKDDEFITMAVTLDAIVVERGKYVDIESKETKIKWSLEIPEGYIGCRQEAKEYLADPEIYYKDLRDFTENLDPSFKRDNIHYTCVLYNSEIHFFDTSYLFINNEKAEYVEKCLAMLSHYGNRVDECWIDCIKKEIVFKETDLHSFLNKKLTVKKHRDVKKTNEEKFYHLLGDKLKEFLTDISEIEIDYDVDFNIINSITNQDEMLGYISQCPKLSSDWSLFLFCDVFNQNEKMNFTFSDN